MSPSRQMARVPTRARTTRNSRNRPTTTCMRAPSRAVRWCAREPSAPRVAVPAGRAGAVRSGDAEGPRRGAALQGCSVARAGAARRAGGRSQSLDVRGLRALGALRDVERDALVLLERAVAARLDLAVVGEHVGGAVRGGDEAEALLGVEPLHGASSHGAVFSR